MLVAAATFWQSIPEFDPAAFFIGLIFTSAFYFFWRAFREFPD